MSDVELSVEARLLREIIEPMRQRVHIIRTLQRYRRELKKLGDVPAELIMMRDDELKAENDRLTSKIISIHRDGIQPINKEFRDRRSRCPYCGLYPQKPERRTWKYMYYKCGRCSRGFRRLKRWNE